MSAIKIIVLLEVFALIVMVVLTALHKFDIAPFKIAFGGFALCLLVLLIGAIICFLSLVIFSFYAQHGTPWSLKLLGVAVGVMPFVLIALIVGKDGFSKPRIHDISTDPSLKLSFNVVPTLRKASDNSIAFPRDEIVEKQKHAYPLIKPIILKADPAQVYKAALATAKNLGWQIVPNSDDQLRFEAIDETTFFGFKDDVVVVVEAYEGESVTDYSVVNVRSVSRVGVSDLGANARRIHRFSEHLRSTITNN